MYHYIRLTYDVPSFIRRFQAIDLLENYIYDHLEEFGCLPRDENVNKMIRESFSTEAHEKENVHIHLMIRMTDEEAVKTAGDRSEFQHASPTDMDKSEKRALRKISKRKRAESTDGDSNDSKKMKRGDCLICLDELGDRKTTTLDCDHIFHYRCIKRWLSIKKVCPVCNTVVDI
jgi:hypothetical protein